MWRAAILLVIMLEVAVCQGEQCSDGGESCVLPQPLRAHKGGQDLDALWLEMRCYLGCVDEVSEVAIVNRCNINFIIFLP